MPMGFEIESIGDEIESQSKKIRRGTTDGRGWTRIFNESCRAAVPQRPGLVALREVFPGKNALRWSSGVRLPDGGGVSMEQGDLRS